MKKKKNKRIGKHSFDKFFEAETERIKNTFLLSEENADMFHEYMKKDFNEKYGKK